MSLDDDEVSETRALYAVLAVASDATGDEIKAAYRRLALLHHPDRKRGACDASKDETDTFARIALAYEVLGHSQRRKRYDLSGELPQSDAALGRAAGETFLAEYVKSAPTVARSVTNKDMSLHSLDNYEVLDVHGKDVPDYMRAIVTIGLGYLVSVVEKMEDKEVALLRHFVMDQMYALIAYEAPLDDSAFAERGYVITYYDHPLQSGIQPSWSDQNTLGGVKLSQGQAALKTIDKVTMDRRKLAALEWHGMPAARPESVQPPPTIPGEGAGPERLHLAVRAFVKAENDPMSNPISYVRRALERILGLDANTLDSQGAMSLMNLILEAMDDDTPEADAADTSRAEGYPATATVEGPKANESSTPLLIVTGSRVRVLASGRVGEVAMYDPTDADLTYKVQFSDGLEPASDWCSAVSVAAAP